MGRLSEKIFQNIYRNLAARDALRQQESASSISKDFTTSTVSSVENTTLFQNLVEENMLVHIANQHHDIDTILQSDVNYVIDSNRVRL